MLPFLVIFATVACGLLAAPSWIIPAAGLALATISYFRHEGLFQRAADLGLQEAIDGTLLGSLFNGLLVSAFGFGAGTVIRMMSQVGA